MNSNSNSNKSKLSDRSRIYEIDLNEVSENDARIIAADLIRENTVILDVGCACGDFGEYVSKKKKVVLYGMEYDSQSISVAVNKAVYKKVHKVDLNSFQYICYPEYVGKFDYITILDVLEHTTNPEVSINELIPYLKKDGELIISLPNISFADIKFGLLQDDFEYVDMGILDNTHLRFFTYKSIAKFFATKGLEISSCKVRVFDVTIDLKSMPRSVKSFVLNNPHSYVYQYIFRARKSTRSKLYEINLCEMDVGFDDFHFAWKKIKRTRLLNLALPLGSQRRAFIKRIYLSLKTLL